MGLWEGEDSRWATGAGVAGVAARSLIHRAAALEGSLGRVILSDANQRCGRRILAASGPLRLVDPGTVTLPTAVAVAPSPPTPCPPMPVTLCNLHEVPSGGVIVQGLPPPECAPSLAMAAAATERLWLAPTWKTCQWAARAPGSPRPWGGIRTGPGEGGAPSEGLFYRQLSLQGYRPPTKAPLVVSSHWEAWGPHSEENEALFHVPLTPSPTHLPREEPRNEKDRCWPQRPVSQWPSEVEWSVSALPLRIPRTRVC